MSVYKQSVFSFILYARNLYAQEKPKTAAP